jgi:hypothetical protein
MSSSFLEEDIADMFFKKKSETKTYDKEKQRPVIKASICNGEQVAGFQDISTGAFEEVMLIKDNNDLAEFMNMYGITWHIDKIY